MVTSDTRNALGHPTNWQKSALVDEAPKLPPQPSRQAETVRPGITMPPTSSTTASEAVTSTPPSRAQTELRTLIVGREISLSGEIRSCNRLVVEGTVEANIADCRYIDIADGGLFKGSAVIDEADIRGRFEGSLIARKRLMLRSTGQIVAKVGYVEVHVEAGGQLSGEIQVLASEEVTGTKSPQPRAQ